MLAKRNNNVYTDLGRISRTSHRVVTIVDTGAGPKFHPTWLIWIISSRRYLKRSLTRHLWHQKPFTRGDRYGPTINTDCPLHHFLHVYLLYDPSGPPSIGHHFLWSVCSGHFPKTMVREQDDWTPNRLIRRPLKLFCQGPQASLPAGLNDTTPAARLMSVINSAEALTVPPHFQCWEKVTTKRQGPVVL